MPKQYTPEQRIVVFWSKVNKNGAIPKHRPELGACWEWQAYRTKSGYGQFKWRGAPKHAQRFAWEITYGEIPDGLFVLHSCDNPPCCNPAHLFLGTSLDNVRDRDAKGRQASRAGVGNGQHKLTSQQVADIRERYAVGDISQYALAREYCMSQPMISAIVRRKNWQG